MMPDIYKSSAYVGKLIPSFQCYFYYDCRMFLKKDKNDERPDSQKKPLTVLRFYLNRVYCCNAHVSVKKNATNRTFITREG